MSHTCQIRWIDNTGEATPDSNPAIGRVRTIDRVEQFRGQGMHFAASDWYNICAEHAKRLRDPGMHIWEFEAIENLDAVAALSEN
jgi:hypothetical protein